MGRRIQSGLVFIIPVTYPVLQLGGRVYWNHWPPVARHVMESGMRGRLGICQRDYIAIEVYRQKNEI